MFSNNCELWLEFCEPSQASVSELAGPRPGTSCLCIVHPESGNQHILLAPVGVAKNMLKMVKASTAVSELSEPLNRTVHSTTMDTWSEGGVQNISLIVPAPSTLDGVLGRTPAPYTEPCIQGKVVPENALIGIPRNGQERGTESGQYIVATAVGQEKLDVGGPEENLSNNPGDEFSSHALVPTPAGWSSDVVMDTPMPIQAPMPKVRILNAICRIFSRRKVFYYRAIAWDKRMLQHIAGSRIWAS